MDDHSRSINADDKVFEQMTVQRLLPAFICLS